MLPNNGRSIRCNAAGSDAALCNQMSLQLLLLFIKLHRLQIFSNIIRNNRREREATIIQRFSRSYASDRRYSVDSARISCSRSVGRTNRPTDRPTNELLFQFQSDDRDDAESHPCNWPKDLANHVSKRVFILVGQQLSTILRHHSFFASRRFDHWLGLKQTIAFSAFMLFQLMV